MATKFKSKYTAQEIEQLLDSIKNGFAGDADAIVIVDALPEITTANPSVFYKYKGHIYFINNGEWVEISTPTDSTTIGGDITIEDEDGEEQTIKAVIKFSDFSPYSDDLHFTLISGSETSLYVYALRKLMKEQGKTYYNLTDAEVYGFMEDFNGNNLLTAIAADNSGHFFLKMDLIDGHEVDITLEQILIDGTELYLIEYVGYAL